MDQRLAYRKPTKAACRRALDETIPDLILDQNFSDATVEYFTNKIMQHVTAKFKGFQYEPYKFIFHVVLTEERGQGLRVQVGGYWDANNDVLVAAKYVSKKDLCCHVTVFSVVLY
ncbi:hypothetical protein M3Y99_01418300 [Aphelenchoides fujianensis]|nr:hypothetical protein M3Y99_01418300 [Aphelenchoides fujianensis]